MTVCSTCKHANYCEIVAGGYSSQVKSCRDYRKGEMTNEEWFCGLSTEEKAKWITENLSVYADEWVKRDEKLLNPVTWEEWLKEKHDEM